MITVHIHVSKETTVNPQLIRKGEGKNTPPAMDGMLQMLSPEGVVYLFVDDLEGAEKLSFQLEALIRDIRDRKEQEGK